MSTSQMETLCFRGIVRIVIRIGNEADIDENGTDTIMDNGDTTTAEAQEDEDVTIVIIIRGIKDKDICSRLIHVRPKGPSPMEYMHVLIGGPDR
ncbi:hypothetical protein TrVGV298_010769 [Trichoderma virens]|nr:hypothetical protein TrVGV298_010769 [Trichoderma virens]